MVGPYQGFGGSGEKSPLLLGIWGEGPFFQGFGEQTNTLGVLGGLGIYFRELGRKVIFQGAGSLDP